MTDAEKFAEMRQIYWQSGVWRRFSWDEFWKGVVEILKKSEP